MCSVGLIFVSAGRNKRHHHRQVIRPAFQYVQDGNSAPSVHVLWDVVSADRTRSVCCVVLEVLTLPLTEKQYSIDPQARLPISS